MGTYEVLKRKKKKKPVRSERKGEALFDVRKEGMHKGSELPGPNTVIDSKTYER